MIDTLVIFAAGKKRGDILSHKSTTEKSVHETNKKRNDAGRVENEMKFETWCLIQDQTLKRELKMRRADK